MSHVVIRALAVYVFLLVVFRIAGKRTMAETDTFDFVMLLIISESTQQALIGDDYSLTTSFLVITTLIGATLVLAFLKQKSPRLERLVDGGPVVLVHDGKVYRDRMDKLRIDDADILAAAHREAGVGRLDQVRYAILERDGHIAIVPRE